MTTQITPQELALFKSYQVSITYPELPTQPGDAVNPVTSATDYKTYPTAKNVPASLKGGADSREKSSGVLPGYNGDVLKSDTTVKEGKGIQMFTNGTVFDGYFQAGLFVKGRMIDAAGNTLTGNFVSERLTGTGELKSQQVQYSGEFKDGVVNGKGILTWTSAENRTFKFNGTIDPTQFVAGKLEIKQNDAVVQTIEGLFNCPFDQEGPSIADGPTNNASSLDLTAELAECQVKLSQSQQEHAAAEKQVEELKQQLLQREQLLAQKATETLASIKELQEIKKKDEEKYALTKKMLEEAQAQLQAGNQQEELSKQCEAFKAQAAALSSQLQVLIDEKTGLISEQQKLRDQTAKDRETIAECKAAQQSLQAKSDSDVQRLQQVEKELVLTKETLAASEAKSKLQLSMLQEQLDSITSAAQLSQLQSKLDIADASLKQLQAQLAEAGQTLATQTSCADKELGALKQELGEWRHKFEAEVTSGKALKSEFSLISETLHKVQQENSSLSLRLTREEALLKQTTDDLRSEQAISANCKAEIGKLKDQINQTKQSAGVEQQLKEAHAKHDLLIKQLQASNEQVRSQQEQILIKESGYQKQLAAYEAQQSQAQQELRKKQSKLATENTDLKTKVEALKKIDMASKLQHTKQVTELATLQQQLKTKDEQLTQKVNELVKDKEQALDRVKAELAAKFDIYQDYRAKMEQLKQKETKLNQDMSDKHAQIQKERSQLQKAEVSQRILQEKEKLMAEEKQHWADQMEAIQRQLQQAQTQEPVNKPLLVALCLVAILLVARLL